jgi:acyl-CoA thioester hydrolase
VPRSLYKQTMLDDLRHVTNDAAAPRVVTPPGGALPPHDIQFRVRYAETDQMGVVYHTNYLIWCEVGRTDFIRARGMSYADIEKSGVGLAVSDLEARFHGAARYDDLIRVRTTLADVRSRSITFDYVITNAETNERLVSASTTLVSIDKNGRLVAIPSMVRALFHPADSHSHPHGETPENR